MSNSPLISYTKISPNKTSPRNHKIDTITIHCVVGQLSAEGICGCFDSPSAKASCNYGIGTDGRIALCVEEKDRSWCSSNGANDNRAVTIECACDKTHPYAINGNVYEALIKLCVDICQRNDIKELKWKGDKSLVGQIEKQNMTVHRWFANKSCPGDYIYERLGMIADEVNARLGVQHVTAEKNYVEKTEVGNSSFPKLPFEVKVLVDDLNYRSAPSMEADVQGKTKKGVFTITEVNGSWGKLKSGVGWIWLGNPKYCTIQSTVTGIGREENRSTPFSVRVDTSNLRIRTGAGDTYVPTGHYTGVGVFTILEVKEGSGSAKGWGRLASGEGWISLDYAVRL